MHRKTLIAHDIYQIADIFKSMSALLGIRQRDIAKKLGIAESSVNNFFKKRSTISEENIFKIASILKINHQWLLGESDIFWESNEILYLRVNNERDLWTFMSFSKNCSYLHIFIPDSPLEDVPRMMFRKKSIIITIVRIENAFCVVETPNIRNIDDFERHFMYEPQTTTYMQNSVFFLKNFENKREILRKIEDRTITEEELNELYSLARIAVSTTRIFLSPEEKELILSLRERKIPASEAKKIFLRRKRLKRGKWFNSLDNSDRKSLL